MLYALFCHEFKPNCNKCCSDTLLIFLRISYPWHYITSRKIKTKYNFRFYFNTFNRKMQEKYTIKMR